MYSNLSTGFLWAGYGVSQCIFQLRVKCKAAVWDWLLFNYETIVELNKTTQHVGIFLLLLFTEMNTFILQRCFKLIKSNKLVRQ